MDAVLAALRAFLGKLEVQEGTGQLLSHPDNGGKGNESVGLAAQQVFPKCAPVAQGIEHWFPKPGVVGSNPTGCIDGSGLKIMVCGFS